MRRSPSCAGAGTTAVLIAGLLIATPTAGRDDARGVLAKARDYVAWYDRQLVALIADERYVQTGRVADGTGAATRVLESEFGWVAIAALRRHHRRARGAAGGRKPRGE